MSNKKSKANNKGKGSKKPAGGAFGAFRDLTAERYLSNRLAKAVKLVQEQEYEEAAEILEELAEKYPNNPQVPEYLGFCYMSMHDASLARDNFERALELRPPEKRNQPGLASGQFLMFNLANMYLLGDFPVLASEWLERVEPAQLAESTDGQFNPEIYTATQAMLEAGLEEKLALGKLNREEALQYERLLELGQVALERNQTETARQNLEEARQRQPDQPAAYRLLSSLYLFEGQADKAIEQLRHILDKIAPNDETTIGMLIRLLVAQGQPGQARSYVERLAAALPANPDLPERLNLAGSLALLNEDQRVYDLMTPLLKAGWLTGEQAEEEAPQNLLSIALLGGIAAANLGRREEALDWFNQVNEAGWFDREELGESPTLPLFERTHRALQNGEEGPGPAGRFYYEDMRQLFNIVLMGNSDLQSLAATIFSRTSETVEDEQATAVRRLLANHQTGFADMLVYIAWLGNDLVSSLVSLELLLGLNPPDMTGEGDKTEPEEKPAGPGLAIVRRLAFERVGDNFLHLLALVTLVRHEYIRQDEPVTLWLGNQQITTTPEELPQKYGQELENGLTGPGAQLLQNLLQASTNLA